jgi:uncharacterized membrane protein
VSRRDRELKDVCTARVFLGLTGLLLLITTLPFLVFSSTLPAELLVAFALVSCLGAVFLLICAAASDTFAVRVADRTGNNEILFVIVIIAFAICALLGRRSR